ncbi:MAG: hypothetical protein ACI9R3_001716 [Verrucomicrobiales bacterium]|jgi:hypothetical protein
MAWESTDPIDRCISSLSRNALARKMLAGGLVVCFWTYALAIATTSLDRVASLAPLRTPLKLVHKVTRTTQSWGVFHTVPEQSEFNVLIHTGYMEPGGGGGLVLSETLGPILPGFLKFNSRRQLRYIQLFQQMLARDIYQAYRTQYYQQLSAALLQRNEELENPPTHFMLELVVTKTVTPAEIRKLRSAPSQSEKVGPLLIGSK